jgi:hypothetical protein
MVYFFSAYHSLNSLTSLKNENKKTPPLYFGRSCMARTGMDDFIILPDIKSDERVEEITDKNVKTYCC